MSISLLATPASAWRPTVQQSRKTALLPRPEKPSEPDWQDYAADERWADAIISYLRADYHRTFLLWKVVNAIVAESGQGSRFDVRAATFECLQELMRLRRERRVFRYKRKWIAILDAAVPIVPQIGRAHV